MGLGINVENEILKSPQACDPLIRCARARPPKTCGDWGALAMGNRQSGAMSREHHCLQRGSAAWIRFRPILPRADRFRRGWGSWRLLFFNSFVAHSICCHYAGLRFSGFVVGKKALLAFFALQTVNFREPPGLVSITSKVLDSCLSYNRLTGKAGCCFKRMCC